MPINWILGHKPQHIEQGLKHVKNGTIKGITCEQKKRKPSRNLN